MKKLICMAVIGTLMATAPANAETLDERLLSEGSHLTMSLEVPFDVVQVLIRDAMKPKYSGKKNDPLGSALKDDVLTWVARPGDVELAGRDSVIHATGSAKGSATIKGTALVLDVSETINLAATAKLQLRPTFRPDWGIEANESGEASLGKAEMKIARIKVSIRKILQPALSVGFNKALKDSAARLRDPSLLRAKMSELWGDACRTVKIGKTQVNIIPDRVAVTQPVVSTNSLRAVAVVSGKTELAVDGVAPECPDLPENLDLLDPLG